MNRRSGVPLAGVAVLALLLCFPGAASARKGGHGDPPATVSTTTTGQSTQGFVGTQTSHHQTEQTEQTQGSASSDSTSSSSLSSSSPSSSSTATPSAYPAAGPYGSWDDAFPRNPNADLSWMPGAVDACGSNWGGDGWNAKYAKPTPCAPTNGKKPAAAPVITVEMVTAAATVAAPSVPPHVQPGAISYVNIPNNYWAEAPTVDTSVTVLGVRIPLRWTPVLTSWNFGDGGAASGNGIKGADLGAAGAVEHAYGRQGSYAISTTTAYDLSFVIPGAGAQTVRLTAPPSPAVILPIREIQTRTDYVG